MNHEPWVHVNRITKHSEWQGNARKMSVVNRPPILMQEFPQISLSSFLWNICRYMQNDQVPTTKNSTILYLMQMQWVLFSACSRLFSGICKLISISSKFQDLSRFYFSLLGYFFCVDHIYSNLPAMNAVNTTSMQCSVRRHLGSTWCVHVCVCLALGMTEFGRPGASLMTFIDIVRQASNITHRIVIQGSSSSSKNARGNCQVQFMAVITAVGVLLNQWRHVCMSCQSIRWFS